jgi:hypothetical protein
MTCEQWCKLSKEKCETNCPECPLNTGGGNGRSCCDLIDDEAYAMTACEVISLMDALIDAAHAAIGRLLEGDK